MKRNKKRLTKGADMEWDHDTLGSYTGVCSDDKYEKPIQDADDL